MADENKAEDSRKMPIPPPTPDDHEDVSWALSTAEATWKRGDRTDALKWLRRAAEAASEAEDDDRALALAKAAAELASDLDGPKPPPPAQIKAPQAMPSRPPPPPSRPAPPPRMPAMQPAMQTIGHTLTQMSPMSPTAAKPSLVEAPDARRSRPPPPIQRTPVAAPVRSPAPAPVIAKPSGASDAMKPRAPVPAVGQRVAVQNSSRGAVMAPQAAKSEPTLLKEPDKTRPVPAAPITAPDIERAARLAAAAKAHGTEITNTDEMTQMMEHPPSEDDRPSSPETPSGKLKASIAPSVDDMDSWPTQAFAGDPPPFDEPNRTRIGTPAYTERAIVVSRAKSAPPDAPAPEVRTSQAVRVVVWRGPDGVHVAPYGTTVSAISVDAMLVALDPAADLSAWLSNK
jgi:hypothetical protein